MTEADQTKFASLKAVHPDAVLHTEGGNPVVLLPDFSFKAGGQDRQMSLLLMPSAHSGYPTRLFFAQALNGVGESRNWTEHTVLSRKWWAPSWNFVEQTRPWLDMLHAHLRAVT